jgi:hypothetical protein
MKRYRQKAERLDAQLFAQDGAEDRRHFVEAAQWQGLGGPVSLRDICNWGCRATIGKAEALRIFVDAENHPDDVAGHNLWRICHVGEWIVRLPGAKAFYPYSPEDFEAAYELCSEDESCPALSPSPG